MEAALELDAAAFMEMARNVERLADRKARLKITRKAVRAGSNLVKTRVKQSAKNHRVTGNLYRGLGLRMRTYKASTDPTPVGIIGNVFGKAFHAHIVEFGSVERFHKRGSRAGLMGKVSGRHPTGKAPKIGFFRSAWTASRQAVLDKMTDTLRKELDTLVNTLPAKGGD